MEKALNLKFKYTQTEYCEAVKWYYSNLFNIKVDFIASVVAIFLGSFFWFTEHESFIFKFLVAMGFILLLMIIFILYINPKRHFKQEPKFQDEYNVGFNNEGILFQTKSINSTIKWSLYSKVKENKSFFYLIYGKYMFSIIPKRAFVDNEEEEIFRQLLEENLDKK